MIDLPVDGNELEKQKNARPYENSRERVVNAR